MNMREVRMQTRTRRRHSSHRRRRRRRSRPQWIMFYSDEKRTMCVRVCSSGSFILSMFSLSHFLLSLSLCEGAMAGTFLCTHERLLACSRGSTRAHQATTMNYRFLVWTRASARELNELCVAAVYCRRRVCCHGTGNDKRQAYIGRPHIAENNREELAETDYVASKFQTVTTDRVSRETACRSCRHRC